jgi:hypothetical protein
MPTLHKQVLNLLLNTLLKRKLLSERLGPLALLEPLAQLEIQELLEFKAHPAPQQRLELLELQVRERRVARVQLEHKAQRD